MAGPKNKTILIVDDESSVVEFLRFAIERDGFDVISTDNGNNAIMLLTKHKVDLILLDMMMPGKSGYELVKLMQSGDYRDIPIIVMSGRFVEDSYQNTLKEEPNVKDYMVKPVKVEMLLYRVNTLLGTLSEAEKRIKEHSEQAIKDDDSWKIQF